jgi:hypothetical protein
MQNNIEMLIDLQWQKEINECLRLEVERETNYKGAKEISGWRGRGSVAVLLW